MSEHIELVIKADKEVDVDRIERTVFGRTKQGIDSISDIFFASSKAAKKTREAFAKIADLKDEDIIDRDTLNQHCEKLEAEAKTILYANTVPLWFVRPTSMRGIAHTNLVTKAELAADLSYFTMIHGEDIDLDELIKQHRRTKQNLQKDCSLYLDILEQ